MVFHDTPYVPPDLKELSGFQKNYRRFRFHIWLKYIKHILKREESIWLKIFYRPVKQEGWSSNYCKLRDSNCFGILIGSISRINLEIRLGKTNFLDQDWVQKSPKLPKIHISRIAGRRKLVEPSKWPQDLIYYGYFTTWIRLRQPKVL